MTDDMPRAVRDLVRGLDRAALATALPVQSGAWPYASLVLVAVDHDLSPILLLSDLAEHTKAIAADGRVSWVPAEAAGGPGGRREPAPRSDDRQLCKLEVVGSIPIGSTNAAAREKRTAHHFDIYDL